MPKTIIKASFQSLLTTAKEFLSHPMQELIDDVKADKPGASMRLERRLQEIEYIRYNPAFPLETRRAQQEKETFYNLCHQLVQQDISTLTDAELILLTTLYYRLYDYPPYADELSKRTHSENTKRIDSRLLLCSGDYIVKQMQRKSYANVRFAGSELADMRDDVVRCFERAITLGSSTAKYKLFDFLQSGIYAQSYLDPIEEAPAYMSYSIPDAQIANQVKQRVRQLGEEGIKEKEPMICSKMGHIYFQKDDIDKAEECFEIMLKAGHSYDGLINLAKIYNLYQEVENATQSLAVAGIYGQAGLRYGGASSGLQLADLRNEYPTHPYVIYFSYFQASIPSYHDKPNPAMNRSNLREQFQWLAIDNMVSTAVNREINKDVHTCFDHLVLEQPWGEFSVEKCVDLPTQTTRETIYIWLSQAKPSNEIVNEEKMDNSFAPDDDIFSDVDSQSDSEDEVDASVAYRNVVDNDSSVIHYAFINAADEATYGTLNKDNMPEAEYKQLSAALRHEPLGRVIAQSKTKILDAISYQGLIPRERIVSLLDEPLAQSVQKHKLYRLGRAAFDLGWLIASNGKNDGKNIAHQIIGFASPISALEQKKMNKLYRFFHSAGSRDEKKQSLSTHSHSAISMKK